MRTTIIEFSLLQLISPDLVHESTWEVMHEAYLSSRNLSKADEQGFNGLDCFAAEPFAKSYALSQSSTSCVL